MAKKKSGRKSSKEQQLPDLRKGANLPTFGGLIDDVLSDLSPAEEAEFRREVLKKGIELEVKRREQADTYRIARQELDDLSDRLEDASRHTGFNSGFKIKQEFKTASGKAQVTARSGRACFIATVVYGSVDAAQVRYLRAYRDQVLIRTSAGDRFVRWYYENGPQMAHFLNRHPWLYRPTKFGLNCMIGLIKAVMGNLSSTAVSPRRKRK